MTDSPRAPATSMPAAPSSSPATSTATETPVAAPAWATLTLTDVQSGSQFRIADLSARGKVVFVETMAIWCTNCRRQQQEATAAWPRLDPETVEWIAVDVESSESPEALARYRESNGFPFTYVVADQALSRALVDDFGDVVLNPPAVNVIIVGADGRVTHLTGHHSADDVVRLAGEHGARPTG